MSAVPNSLSNTDIEALTRSVVNEHNRNNPDRVVLAVGIVGSHSYGLSTPESDIDMAGVSGQILEEYCGLGRNDDTWTRQNDPALPDTKVWELQKFAQLAASANPAILEFLYLDDDLYVKKTLIFNAIIDQRHVFLSNRVRLTYGGYARQQLKRFMSRDGSFSSDTNKRKAKHARHIARLAYQGEQLLRTGTLTVRLDDEGVERCRAAEALVYDPPALERYFEEVLLPRIDNAPSVLPDEPNRYAINDMLYRIRKDLDL